jgi:hypothetical protein
MYGDNTKGRQRSKGVWARGNIKGLRMALGGVSPHVRLRCQVGTRTELKCGVKRCVMR